MADELVFTEERIAVPDGTLFRNASEAEVLEALGLDRVARVFEPGFARIQRQFQGRENGIVEVAGLPRLFLKRHPAGTPPWGLVEWSNLKQFARAGIPIPTPVAAGVGENGCSFLLTREIEGGGPLDDLAREGKVPPPLAREVRDELAELTARMHAAGLCHKDFYLCHIFLLPEAPAPRLRVIDLQRAAPTGWLRRKRWLVKDLAALTYSSVGLPVTDRIRLRFLVRYMGGAGGPSARRCRRRLARRIWGRACRLIRRHGILSPPA